MSTADESPAQDENRPPAPQADAVPRRGVRWRWAVVILAGSALVIGALQFAPGEAFPDQFRNFLSLVTVGATVVALFVWLAVFSRLPARKRVIAVAAYLVVLAVPLALVRGIEFTGDVVPHFVFRWEPDPLDVLEAHRRRVEQSAGDEAPGVDLAADFPAFRGADRLGVYRGPAIREDWESQPPELLWRQPIGEGYAQIVLSGNLAVTIEQRGSDEAIVAYDARTGRERWVFAYPTRFSEPMGGDGPRATPTIADGRVYALGANGHLSCLELASGEKVWQTMILKQPESANLEWGMAGSPLVLDDVVVVNPGAPQSAEGAALVAYNRASGDVAWKVGDATAAYASPTYAVLNDVPQILTLEADHAVSYAADGSAELWRFPWETMNGINCSQPVPVDANRVLITAGYTMGSALLSVARDSSSHWNIEPVWQETSLRGKFSTPVITDDAIFGLDEGVLVCVDLETGERLWKRGRYGHGQVLLADDKLFIQAEDGDVALVAADREKYRELARITVFKDRTWNTPALAAGHAFLRNHREMACYDLTTAGL